MKLITEANAPNFDAIKDFSYKSEKDSDGVEKKVPQIKGVFIQVDTPNRNGRVYPRSLMEKCVESYKEERFPNNRTPAWRTYGELGHPDGVEINLHRVSHIIKELEWQDNYVIGTANLVDTEYGRIAESLLRAGGQLGVSSRGIGALGESLGNTAPQVTDFQLICVDIVADPSAPEGFVEGILESVDFIRAGGNHSVDSLMRSDLAYGGLTKALSTLPVSDRKEYLNTSIKNFLSQL